MSHFSFKSLDPGGFNSGLIGSTCTALPGRAKSERRNDQGGGAQVEIKRTIKCDLQSLSSRRFPSPRYKGGRAKAWCLHIHADASLALQTLSTRVLSLQLAPPYQGTDAGSLGSAMEDSRVIDASSPRCHCARGRPSRAGAGAQPMGEDPASMVRMTILSGRVRWNYEIEWCGVR